jgi:hypothetical protein
MLMVLLYNDNDNGNMTMIRMMKVAAEATVNVKGLKVPSEISKMEEKNDNDDEDNGGSRRNRGSAMKRG